MAANNNTPAFTAAWEAAQTDARLVQLKLKAQERIIQGRGAVTASHTTTCDSKLVAALTSSSVLKVQRQQATLQQATRAPHAGAVLDVLLQHWQKLMQERLHAAQMLLPDIPLASAPRSQLEVDDNSDVAHSGSSSNSGEAWRDIGQQQSPWVTGADAAPACIKLLYTADDLLQMLTTVVTVARCTGRACCAQCDKCSPRPSSSTSLEAPGQQQPLMQLTLLQSVHAPNRRWLQSFFAELQPDQRQVGLDDVLHPWYNAQRVQQARSIAASCSAAACRAAARTGVPASERPWVWATALGLPGCPPRATAAGATTSSGGADSCQATPSAAEDQRTAWWHLPNLQNQERLQLLCEAVKQQALLVDVLTCADTQQMADSAHFFVFQDAMHAILLAFSRDQSVSGSCAAQPHTVMAAGGTPAADHPQHQQQQLYPPSGVLPFQGLAAYLAPLLFLYGSPAATYPVWHAMYCQYWCRLHSLDSNQAPSAGLPVLCRTFLDLLQEVDPEVYRHLGSLTASPLDMVLPWLLSAFAAHLAPSETLLLWDRIIGYDSLLPLPVLAVAVLTFRRDLVLASETSEELAELLQDLGQLRVVPLLQALLFDA